MPSIHGFAAYIIIYVVLWQSPVQFIKKIQRNQIME